MANGFIQTPEQAKQTILSDYRNAAGSRSFGSLYAANELAGARATQQVEQQYGEQIGAAYKTAMAQRANILESNLGTGYKTELSEDVQKSLNQAYDAYMSKMSQSKQQIAETVNEANTEVDDVLQKYAENTAAYRNAHGDYAQSWVDYMRNNLSEEEYAKFITSPDWRNYVTLDFGDDESAASQYQLLQKFVDAGIMTDQQLRETYAKYYRLKTTEELNTPTFVEEVDPETGETFRKYTSIVDDEGNITAAGKNYFDFLENYAATRQGKGPSWEEYLSENNPELLDWAKTYNPYNYTDDPTNAGTFRTVYGTASTDYKYTFLEEYGGLSKKEVDATFGEMTSIMNKSVDDIKTSDVKGLISSYRQLAEQMGYDSERVDWSSIEQQADVYLQQIKEYEEEIKAKKTSKKVGEGIGYGVGAAAIVGGLISIIASVVSVPFTAGASAPAAAAGVKAGVGLIVGGAAGIGTAAGAAEGTQKQIEALEGDKKAQENLLKQMYLNSLGMMVSDINQGYAKQQSREAAKQRR